MIENIIYIFMCLSSLQFHCFELVFLLLVFYFCLLECNGRVVITILPGAGLWLRERASVAARPQR